MSDAGVAQQEPEPMSGLDSSIYLILILTLVPQAFASSKPKAIDVLVDRLDSQRSSPSVQVSAAGALLQRLLPAHVNSFQFNVVSKVALLLG